jgi:hypothetical protein
MTDPFTIIRDQAAAMAACGAPIRTVSISAPMSSRVGVMVLRWGMADEPYTPTKLGVKVGGASSPPDTVLEVEASESEILDAAWRLGAWDVARYRIAPLPPAEDPMEPKWGITADFCGCPYEFPTIGGEVHPGAVKTFRARGLIRAAAGAGYQSWRFKPVAYASRVYKPGWIKADASLAADGTRDGRCPLKPFPADREPPHGETYMSLYELGRERESDR